MTGFVWEKAFELATDQHGFITFDDLLQLGSDPALLRQWNQRGRVNRIGQGIYRFPQIPTTPMDPFMMATLWPSGRGVISHISALELHELCDVNPDEIHVTIPPNYRPRRKGGERYVIHRERLDEIDITWHDGIRIVTPEVAIRQSIEIVPRQLIQQSIETARRLGRVPHDALRELSNRLEIE